MQTALDQQNKEIREILGGISNRFKPIVDDGVENSKDITTAKIPEGQSPQDAMKTPYRLYGVATRRDVVYLLHPVPESDPPTKQWWRVQYDAESASPTILRNAVSLSEVLERATTESASALLIYANDDALSVEPLPLSKPLEDFVKKDNFAFMEELQTARTADWGYNVPTPQNDWDGNGNPAAWNDDEWGNNGTRDFRNESETLTPNTEVESVEVQEIVAIDWDNVTLEEAEQGAEAGKGVEAMDVDAGSGVGAGEAVKPVGKVSFKEDVEMMDGSASTSAGTGTITGGNANGDEKDDVTVQHIEVLEKKGG